MANAAEPRRPPAPPRRYGLFVVEGTARIFWKLRDEGVTLSAEGISWWADGRERARAWNEIGSVNLTSGYIHKQGSTYNCTIGFRDGSVLRVHSVSAWGHTDEEREPVYREFVETLHARLARPEFSDVHFTTGTGATRALSFKITLVVASLFFVGLPLVLVFLEPLQALLIAAAGAAFVWPMWRMAQTNAPREYSPRDLPYDLLP